MRDAAVTEKSELTEPIIDEALFRSFFDNAFEGILVHENGRIVDANIAFAEMFGYNRSELIGKDGFILIAQESKVIVKTNVVSGYEGCYKAVGLKKDGTKFIMEIKGKDHIYKGKKLRMTAVRDITTEEELLNSEQRFRSIVDTATDAIFTTDSDDKIVSTNPAAEILFGYTKDELIGKCVTDLMPKRYRKAHKEGVKRYITTGKPKIVGSTVEIQGLKKDDTEFPIELSLATWNTSDGCFFTGIIRDISDRKKAEEALWISEQRYRTLVETTSECICKLDTDGNFKYMSPAGLRSHAMISVEEVKGKHCTELVEPAYHELLITTLEKAKKGKTQTFQYESDTIQGVKWFESILTPQKDNNGNVISLIRVSRDITDRVTAEQKIRESWTKLQRTLEDTVTALASTAGLRDPYTAGHQQRVAKLASAIAKELRLSRETVEGIRVASTLHDIGKIYVPAEILSKPGKLSEFEFKMIQAHAQASFDILKDIDFPWPIAMTVLQHHERLDGSGYPNGLRASEIIDEAKILAVADVVEAMSSRRPYRAGLGIESALAEIEKNRGRLYDKNVSEACMNLFMKKAFDFRER